MTVKSKKKNRLTWLLLATVVVIVGLIASFYIFRTKQGVIAPLSNIWFNPPTFLFSIYGEGENTLHEPVAVCSSPDGRIFAADAANNDIKVFDQNGKFKYKFSQLGSLGRLISPVGIAVNGADVYVTDSTNNQIYIFDLDGNFKGALISAQTKAQLTAFTPVGIKIAQNSVFFTDILYHRVVQTNLSGNLIKTIGGPGSQEGRLAFPNDLAIAADGKIYVSDSNNFRVQVCQDGQRLKLFSNSDTSKPKSVIDSLVRGIAVDDNNYVWIVNTLGNSVHVFDAKGHPVYVLDGAVSSEGVMSFPNGISIDKNRLYVTDRGNDRVAVFER